MVHISPETLRRHPIIGVLFGGATAAFLVYLLSSGMGEARELLSQKAPDRLSLHEVVNQQGVRWVTVSEGEWHCGEALSIGRRSWLERLVRGPVDATEVPITGTTDGEVLVAVFDGAVPCERRAGTSLTGVVRSAQIFSNCSAVARWRHAGARVTILEVGATPRLALIMMVGLIAITVGAIVFAGFYLKRMLRSGDRPITHLTMTRPIE